MDDILKRLGSVEAAVSEVRTQVGAISAVIPHLATKANLTPIETSISELRAVIPHLATKADLKELKADLVGMKADLADVKTSVASMEAAVIKWLVATVLASATLAFTVAKFVH